MYCGYGHYYATDSNDPLLENILACRTVLLAQTGPLLIATSNAPGKINASIEFDVAGAFISTV